MRIRKSIHNIEPYEAGKSLDELIREYGFSEKEVIKLASNENPLGPPSKAVSAIKNFANLINIYPDPNALGLREALSKHIKIPAKNIIVGSGSDEILDFIAKLFLETNDEVIIPIPTFSEYEIVTKIAGGKPIYVPLSNHFELDDEKILEAVSNRTKLVFIARPNNPTGRAFSTKKILRIIKAVDAIVVLDEAYIEFDGKSLIELALKYNNLIVSRTFSKAYGLAGLRVGYATASKEIIEPMFKIKPPFNISLLAQKAAIAALEDKKHLKKTIETAKHGREYLITELSKINGLKVFPSDANFILVNTKNSGLTSTEVFNKLLQKGIVIRDCKGFRGLDNYHIRISVGTNKQNQKLVEALRQIKK